MSRILDRIAAVQPYWDAYWQGDLPMLCAIVPREPGRAVPKPAVGITRGTDLEALADSLLAWAAANEFVGGAIPFYCVYLFDVYNLTGMALGGKVEECGDSHRMVPFVDDLDAAELAVDPDSDLLSRLGDIVARLRARCGEEILISASAIGGNLDVLEAIRGSTQLLLDLVDNPDGVHRCLRQIDEVCAWELEQFAALYQFDTYGSVCRHGMYTTGKVGVPQCDFGYMIGPERFSEFALPYLRREFARLDGVCYHLDGVGNLPNLEALCAEPSVHLIQWVPGAGHERDDWSWLRQRIDELGKGQILGGTVETFESWYAGHRAPWQYWSIHVDSADAVTGCLRNLGVP